MGPAPELSAGPPPREWTPQSSASEIAAWVDQGCRRARTDKNTCVERALTAALGQAGVSRSMEALDSLAIRDPDVRDLAHALAHGLGISAYQSPETVAATFAGCPVSQMSGCFHGVVQGYFLDLASRGQPIGQAELDALCTPHQGEPFLFFQCAHGMGHGLMAVHDNHLPMSLQACDQVSNEFIRESCYGGAIMENVVHSVNPHHTAAGHAEAVAHLGPQTRLRQAGLDDLVLDLAVLRVLHHAHDQEPPVEVGAHRALLRAGRWGPARPRIADTAARRGRAACVVHRLGRDDPRRRGRVPSP